MPVASDDYDLCIITNEWFSQDTTSQLCPVVGVCGHSFTKQGIENWYEGRKTDNHHRRKFYIPCAYNCARKWVNKNGCEMVEPIRAFKPNNLVPNVALCEALAVIRRVETDKAAKNHGEDFVYCSICNNSYSSAAAPSGLQHHPRAPVVGVCGHTFCASCINDKHQKEAMSSDSKYLQCPQCQEEGAFYLARLVSNHSLKDALIRWEEIAPPIDYQDLYRKEKAKCNALKDQHDKEMEVLKDLLKEYEALKLTHKRELEAQTQLIDLSTKKEARYKCLYEKKTAECNALKTQHDKKMEEAQIECIELCRKKEAEYKELNQKKTDEYDAQRVLHEKEMNARRILYSLYRKKTAEYDALKNQHEKELEKCESLEVDQKIEIESSIASVDSQSVIVTNADYFYRG